MLCEESGHINERSVIISLMINVPPFCSINQRKISTEFQLEELNWSIDYFSRWAGQPLAGTNDAK